MTFNHKLCQLILVGWLLAEGGAEAATSCTISTAPTEFMAVYSSTANVRVNTSVTVTCRTTSGTQTVNFSLTPNNGLSPSGTQNRAKLGGNSLNYDFYTNNACTSAWTGASNTIIATTTGVGYTITLRQCVKPTTPAPTAGYYTDSETFTLTTSTPGVTITGSNPWVFPVSIGVPTSCQIKTPPGNINFGTYTAFSATPLTTSGSFATRCTANNLGMTLSIGTTAGGVIPGTGLNYSLAINTTSSGGSNPLTSTSGSTGTQTFYINGTMPAGQAGTCTTGSCSGSDTRTLTITY